MSERRWTGTWLSGVRAAGVDLGYPGQRLGLPQQGPGSVASFGRRLGAIVIDWLLCMAISYGLLRAGSGTTLGVFAVENFVLLSTLGGTVGMRLFRIRVASLRGGRPGPLMVLVRTVLLCLAIPAFIWDRDQRGLHDRAANVVVVRS